MKKLTSLCKKLPCSSFLCFLSFLSLFLNLSCMKDSSKVRSKTFGVLKTKLPFFPDNAECISLKSSLETPIGNFLIRLFIDEEKNKTFLQIEDEAYEFKANEAPKNACKGEPATMSYFANLLERSIPACQIAQTREGFSCTLPYRSAKENLEQLKRIKLALLRQVKRVPYLLSRRLTLAENLASFLTGPQWGNGIRVFCGVMKGSLPAEQALLLSSKEWKEALCNNPGSEKKRFETALIVLTKAVEEISFMHVLQDQANLAGNLLVHVQNDMLPASGKVWVKLEPANLTMSNVLLAAESVRSIDHETFVSVKKGKLRKAQSKQEEDLQKPVVQDFAKIPRACWFPGFSMRDPLFAPGRFIQLWGHRDDSPCEQVDDKAEIASIAYYFIETISAETSFELSESNTKPLSLPAGPYRYSVYEFPDKLGVKLENNLVHQGLIVWNGKQQGLSIAKAK